VLAVGKLTIKARDGDPLVGQILRMRRIDGEPAIADFALQIKQEPPGPLGPGGSLD